MVLAVESTAEGLSGVGSPGAVTGIGRSRGVESDRDPVFHAVEVHVIGELVMRPGIGKSGALSCGISVLYITGKGQCGKSLEIFQRGEHIRVLLGAVTAGEITREDYSVDRKHLAASHLESGIALDALVRLEVVGSGFFVPGTLSIDELEFQSLQIAGGNEDVVVHVGNVVQLVGGYASGSLGSGHEGVLLARDHEFSKLRQRRGTGAVPGKGTRSGEGEGGVHDPHLGKDLTVGAGGLCLDPDHGAHLLEIAYGGAFSLACRDDTGHRELVAGVCSQALGHREGHGAVGSHAEAVCREICIGETAVDLQRGVHRSELGAVPLIPCCITGGGVTGKHEVTGIPGDGAVGEIDVGLGHHLVGSAEACKIAGGIPLALNGIDVVRRGLLLLRASGEQDQAGHECQDSKRCLHTRILPSC